MSVAYNVLPSTLFCAVGASDDGPAMAAKAYWKVLSTSWRKRRVSWTSVTSRLGFQAGLSGFLSVSFKFLVSGVSV